ncbi:FAD-dependent thymidylate synthase [Patescibacteria group bacterium]|nr:FAD-dependent thymidylate synthase [Patescibacteria group bacterium]
MEEKLLKHAKAYINSSLSFKWTEQELRVVDHFFTNRDGRIFFIHSLPVNMITVLMAMYSRLRNTRGLRGMMVDNFLPQVLSAFIAECQEKFDGNQMKFLKENKIETLDDFIDHSDDTKQIFEDFMTKMSIDVGFLQEVAQSKKMRVFLSTWLDKYGHNSIARPAMLYVCFEHISILLAKSLEWTRPGAGYIELSTRYVDMAGKDLYPIEKELAEYGISEEKVLNVLNESFAAYRKLQGEDMDGPMPSFLKEHYSKAGFTGSDLEQGIMGETWDVLGNLLPSATLTSVGMGISGEALPSLIHHLQLDKNPEFQAAVELFIEEANKIGATQFLRHLDITDWEKSGWGYLLDDKNEEFVHIPDIGFSENALYDIMRRKAGFQDCKDWTSVIAKLNTIPRSEYDKLYREFEVINVVFGSKMSFRGWRDLQRMGMSTHRRGYLNPANGFYKYDKPAPDILHEQFERIHKLNKELFDEMTEKGVPKHLKEYPLALGTLVPFIMGSNLRQWEFCNWQRTKYSVNHEVRQFFLKFESQLRDRYPWWRDISRADVTPAYTFARGRGMACLLRKDL